MNLNKKIQKKIQKGLPFALVFLFCFSFLLSSVHIHVDEHADAEENCSVCLLGQSYEKIVSSTPFNLFQDFQVTQTVLELNNSLFSLFSGKAYYSQAPPTYSLV